MPCCAEAKRLRPAPHYLVNLVHCLIEAYRLPEPGTSCHLPQCLGHDRINFFHQAPPCSLTRLPRSARNLVSQKDSTIVNISKSNLRGTRAPLGQIVSVHS